MKNVYKVLSICLIVAGLVCPGCKPSSTAQVEENKALVQGAIEEMNKANWAIVKELLAPDFIWHSLNDPNPLTRDELVQAVRMFYAIFPDGRYTIEDIIAEGDKVVTRLIFRGTHKGEFEGLPATGKEMARTSIVIFRIADGKIAEVWEEYDALGFMRQLGAIPSQ